jgi:hypothetical protein
MFRTIVVAMGLVLTTPAAIADPSNKLVGTWKVLSIEVQFKDGSPSRHVYGVHPIGYVIYTAEGRAMAIYEAEERKPAQTDPERAALIRSMIAVSAAYRLDGDDKYIAKIDVSWNPSLRNQEQVRFYKVDGDRLEVTSGWAPSPNLPGKPVTRGVFMFERAK